MYTMFTPQEVMNIRKAFPELGLQYTKHNHPSIDFSAASLQVGTVVITKTSVLAGDALEEDIAVAPINLHAPSYSLLRKVKEYVEVNYANADLR